MQLQLGDGQYYPKSPLNTVTDEVFNYPQLLKVVGSNSL